MADFASIFSATSEENRQHIHVKAGEDEAKFWLDPRQLASNYGFSSRELNELERLVEQNEAVSRRLGMSTLVSTDAKSQRAYVPTTALAKSVNFDEDMMHVLLTDGRCISIPIIWFPLLRVATPDQRSKYEIGGWRNLTALA